MDFSGPDWKRKSDSVPYLNGSTTDEGKMPKFVAADCQLPSGQAGKILVRCFFFINLKFSYNEPRRVGFNGIHRFKTTNFFRYE
ncbi:hypothetical protein BWI93_12400 [Siphonobacter sp. BAB-5385]|nr:hypothetical protein BWI93_12400 [Siphonobacter sp. BAB-5385]